jgi:hypothetical protein
VINTYHRNPCFKTHTAYGLTPFRIRHADDAHVYNGSVIEYRLFHLGRHGFVPNSNDLYSFDKLFAQQPLRSENKNDDDDKESERVFKSHGDEPAKQGLHHTQCQTADNSPRQTV